MAKNRYIRDGSIDWIFIYILLFFICNCKRRWIYPLHIQTSKHILRRYLHPQKTQIKITVHPSFGIFLDVKGIPWSYPARSPCINQGPGHNPNSLIAILRRCQVPQRPGQVDFGGDFMEILFGWFLLQGRTWWTSLNKKNNWDVHGSY